LSMPSRARAGNLTAALVFVSFLELVLNRLASRLFLPQSMVSGGAAGGSPSDLWSRAIAGSGPFLFHLTGILALFIFVPALAGLMRRHELFPRPVLARFTVGVIALGFWSLLALGVLLGHVPRQFFLLVET